MSIVAETATLAHGYTMAQVENFTRIVVKSCRIGYILDEVDRWDHAWFGIVEKLYGDSSAPTRNDLINAGYTAIERATATEFRHHGRSGGVGTEGHGFRKYWLPVTGGNEDFTDRIAERLALPQVLAELTDREYQIIAAHAAHGSPAAAAAALGMSGSAYRTKLSQARKRLQALWFEHETPRAYGSHGSSDQCRYGHSRTEHSYRKPNGKQQCRLCGRNAERRRMARMSNEERDAERERWRLVKAAAAQGRQVS